MPILPGLAPTDGVASRPSRSFAPSHHDSSLTQSYPLAATSSTMDISEELYLRFFDAPRLSDGACTAVVVLSPHDVLRLLNPHSHEDRQLTSQLADALNALGRASAHAQCLRMPITSYKRFIDSDHRLYLLASTFTSPSSPATAASPPTAAARRHQLVGLLKVGHKKLYLNNATGHLHECHPLCVLDFFVSESSQRKGYGRLLFDHMLRGEGVVDPCELAYDRPSPKMVAFLRRHFALVEGMPQPNNYMVFWRQQEQQQELDGLALASNDGVGNQAPMPQRPRSNRSKLPPLLPATLPSVATARLPELRRTHSTASSTPSHPSAPSSASSMGELARACFQWPSSPTSSHHHSATASAAAPSAECATAETQQSGTPPSPHLPVDHSSSKSSRPAAMAVVEPLAAFRANTSTRSHAAAHPTTRIALGMGNIAGCGGDRSVAAVAAALKARGAILPHLSVSSVVGRR